MTIEIELNSEEFTADGTLASYPFQVKIFDRTHLKVYVVDPADDLETEQLLTEGDDYNIPNAGINNPDGGQIELVDAEQDWINDDGFLATGWKLIYKREVPLLQPYSIKNQREFYASIHEKAWDYFVMVLLSFNDRISGFAEVNDLVEDALAAASAAAASEDAAAASAAAAAASATAAGTSATNAAASETAAAGSATTAGTAATNASTSATAAATSATNAANSATAADSSADNAADSANDADTYADLAALSQASATTSATNAANSATAAAGSATAAGTSATNAATSETNAANSATAAAASAASINADSRLTAWVNFNGTGTVAMRDNKGVSGITDGGTGQYEVNWSPTLADANYAATMSVGPGVAGAQARLFGGPINANQTTSKYYIRTFNTSASAIDVEYVMVIVAGGN